MMYGIQGHSSTFLTELSKFLEVVQKHAQTSKTKQIRC
jgi:hypothetical protein